MRVGNEVTVRVLAGMTDQPVDRRQHPVADVMLEHLGIRVDLRPVETQHLDQERLEDPVPAHHRDRLAPTARR